MVSIQEYKAAPCKALSIPYWKAANMTVPPNIRIVHDSEFEETLLEHYADKKFFRLIHLLDHIPDPDATIDIVTISAYSAEQLADMINRSYGDSGICVSAGQVKGWTTEKVYCPELWLGAVWDGKLIGSIICDFDAEVGEGIIEWLQVLPEYRGRGAATALTCEALRIMSAFADFATVSGECGNVTNPEAVYRKCGFQGDDAWHILTMK